jgi:5-(hydroxymethyl)furfural/furfural oxidase
VTTQRTFDTIIVGAGSAGCVLANRLSARSSHAVLLIEAGMDTPAGHEPADILDTYPTSYYNDAYFWRGLKAHWGRSGETPEISYLQGRVLGGGSSVMGMLALRGIPEDYDEWEWLGAAGWGWRDVLPYFKRLETDVDFTGEMHGDAGPVSIRHIRLDDLPPFARAIEAFARERQMPHVADMNADFRDGHCTIPLASTPERRQSSAICYLPAEVRRRSNLTVLGSSTVTRLINDSRRIVGVAVTTGGATQEFRAREVILSSGGLQSPAFLMRAGIGPANELRRHGIDVLAELPGVGQNLQNHAVLFFATHMRRGAEHFPNLRPYLNTAIRYSSNLPDCPQTDMCLMFQSKTSWSELGRRIGNIQPVLWKPASRGQVTLRSAEPGVQPLIEFNFLSDQRDLLRLTDAARRSIDILCSKEMLAIRGKAFPVAFSDRLRLLNRRTAANKISSAVLARLLDYVPGFDDLAFRVLTNGTFDLAALAADREALVAHVKANVAGVFHSCGTCRIGPAGDPGAVVDPTGKVHKMEGLRVVDASIMPAVPRANTNIPTIMVAEKIAAGLLAAA